MIAPLLWPIVDHPLAGTMLVNGRPHRREFRVNPHNGRVTELHHPLPSRLFITASTEESDNDN